MTPRQRPASDLVKRLLADAEEKAAEGRVREGYVLLRWASRLAPRNVVPVVLLTYHRLRTAGQVREVEVGDRGLSRRAASGLSVSASCGGGVTADALGFPVPRFPTRAPDLDRTAFVPAPRRAEDVGLPLPPRALPATPSIRVRHPHVGWLAPALAAFLMAAAASSLVPARYVPGWIHGVRGDPADAADAALRAGDPSRALALTQGIVEPGPRLLLIRGRAAIATGDTGTGRRAWVAAADHPLASAREAAEAGRLLTRLHGAQTDAANAYLRAFELGLPRDEWMAVAHALERDRRHAQARRLRTMLTPGNPSDLPR